MGVLVELQDQLLVLDVPPGAVEGGGAAAPFSFLQHQVGVRGAADAGGTGAGGTGAGSEITEKSAVAVPVVDTMAML